jgi:hypothetical protein
VPQAIDDVVRRCLEKDPVKRFPDVAALARALAEVTPSEEAHASAARVARVATVAPAVRGSDATLPAAPSVRPPSMDEPTRTASAWGETGPDSRESKGRRFPYGIAAVVLAGTAIVVALALTRAPTTASAPVAAASSVPADGVVAATPPTPASSATPVMSTDDVLPAPPAKVAASASAASGGSPSTVHPAAPQLARPAASTPAAASSSVPRKPGLFDDRE